MSLKNEKVGVVVSDKMDKGVVVAVERKVRNHLYGKIQRRTSTLHGARRGEHRQGRRRGRDCRNAPAQQRKRWVMTRVVRKAVAV